jgi:TP901 family phage tail tape measure protein
MAAQNEKRTVDLNITGNSGQEIDKLKARVKALTKEFDSLNKSDNPKLYAQKSAELKRLKENYDKLTTKGLVINGKAAEVSMKNLGATIKGLIRDLQNLKEADNPAVYRQKVADIKKLNETYKEMRASLTGVKTETQKFIESSKQIMAGVLGGNIVTGVFMKVQQGISDSIDLVKNLSDELTNIEKTTNMSPEDVAQLNDELGKIDTRTGRQALREFAVEAGKLGKNSVEDVRKFVEQADKINVALGSDIGKDAVIEIARLADIFKEDMLNIGSAINSIGQASVATEVFQVDFLKRTSSIGKTAGLSSKELLGYGAALEIAGQTAEVSGTAMTQFLIEFTKDSEKFGAAAGMAKGEMTKLMDEKGTNAAFIEFLRLFKEGSGSAEVMFKKLEDLSIDGQRGAAGLVALAQNWGNVIEQQKVAAESAGSIQTEFDKRNNNAAAQYEKAMKRMEGALLGFKATMGGFFIWLGTGLANNIGLILNMAKVVLAGGVAWLTYKTIVIGSTLVTRLLSIEIGKNATVLALQRMATLAGAAAQALFTGNIGRANAAMRVFNATAAMNPWGALIAGIAATVTLVALFSDKTQKLTETQKAMASATTEAAKAIANEKNEYDRNAKILGDKNNAEAVREAALNRMIALNPEWLGGLTMENYHTAEGIGIRNRYNTELLRSAELKAKIAKVDAISSEIEDLRAEKQTPGTRKSWYEKGLDMLGGQGQSLLGDAAISAQIDKEIKAKQDAVNKLNEDINKLQVKEPEPGFISSITGVTYKTKAELDRAEKAYKDAQENKQKTAKTDQELIDEAHKAMEEDAKFKEEMAKTDADMLEEAYQLEISYSQKVYDALETDAGIRRADGKITKQQYEDELSDIELRAMLNRLELQKKYGKEGAKVEADIIAERIKARDSYEKNPLGITEFRGSFTGDKGPTNFDKDKNDKDPIEETNAQKAQRYANYANQINDIANTMHQIEMNRMQNELDLFNRGQNEKKKSLDSRLKKGIISQEKYDEEMAKINEATLQKENALKMKAYDNQRKADRNQALVNGALAITSILAQYPKFDGGFAMAAALILAAGATAAQVAAIENTPVPQFYGGGRTDVVGASDGRRYNAKRTDSFKNGGRYSQPTLGLIGERGPELVIPNWIYTSPKYANVMGALEAAIYSKQYYRGGATGAMNGTGATAVTATQVPQFVQGDDTQKQINMLMLDVLGKLNTRLENPIEGTIKWDQQGFEDYNRLRDRAKALGTL